MIKAYFTLACYKIVKFPLFDVLIVGVILTNAAISAMEDPLAGPEDWMVFMDDVFLWIYVGEAALKIFAFGFIWNKGSYMRDNWNLLDFFIVVTSLMSKYSSASNLSSLRTLRILRPLRTVAKVESLKKMLAAIFASFGTLKDITIIMFFFYTLYAIAGQMVFSGNLKQQCFLLESGIS